MNILNRGDSCCFGESQHEPALADGLKYDDALREYERRVRQTLTHLGNADLFRIEIDEAAQEHTITWDAIYDSILAELNGSRRIIGVSPDGEALARGISGTPVFFANDTLVPNNLGEMIGVPAILTKAMHVNDAFYRTASNRLAHVRRPGYPWSFNRILDEDIINGRILKFSYSGIWDYTDLGGINSDSFGDKQRCVYKRSERQSSFIYKAELVRHRDTA